MNDSQKAVLTVVGKDEIGILAKTAQCCADANANVMEVTQNVSNGFFTMMMILDIGNINCSLNVFQATLKDSLPGMETHIMHENIFNSMHRI